MRKAIFLDRDGTINEDKGYTHRIEDLIMLPNAITGMKTMQELGYILIIVTNQSGIGRGYYPEQEFIRFQKHLLSHLSEKRINIAKTYHCPHAPEIGCECRKPKHYMLLKAKDELGIDLKRSFVIGDREGDILMGKAADCRTILIRSKDMHDDTLDNSSPDNVSKDLYEAALWIKDDDTQKA